LAREGQQFGDSTRRIDLAVAAVRWPTPGRELGGVPTPMIYL
jgi:hypothetical protein